jgi:hypothetical protein
LSLYNPSARITQKTQSLYCCEGLFTYPLPSNVLLTIACVGSAGNVFTESLPSNGSIRHNTIYRMATVCLLHFKYTQSTVRDTENLFALVQRTYEVQYVSTWAPFVTLRMSKRYSILRHVFSSTWGVTSNCTALLILARSSATLPNLEGIPGPLCWSISKHREN